MSRLGWCVFISYERKTPEKIYPFGCSLFALWWKGIRVSGNKHGEDWREGGRREPTTPDMKLSKQQKSWNNHPLIYLVKHVWAHWTNNAVITLFILLHKYFNLVRSSANGTILTSSRYLRSVHWTSGRGHLHSILPFYYYCFSFIRAGMFKVLAGQVDLQWEIMNFEADPSCHLNETKHRHVCPRYRYIHTNALFMVRSASGLAWVACCYIILLHYCYIFHSWVRRWRVSGRKCEFKSRSRATNIYYTPTTKGWLSWLHL